MTVVTRPEHAITLDMPVPFHQCDPLGVLWHGRYFEYFETARTALLTSVGLAIPEIQELGFRMYVTEARCRYMSPLIMDDVAEVTAWFSKLSPLIRVAYDIRCRGSWVARATTVLATTRPDGSLLTSTPDAILDRLPSR